MEEEIIDHVIWEEENRGDYRISIVARLKAPNLYNVQYMVRLENPDEEAIDYMLSLDGFKKLGRLCLALSKFCKESIIADEKQVKTLQKLLTVENIQNYVKISAMKNKKARE
ncbi:MAG: hypothetical protein FJ045_02635 [Crenarchaeota archaeon]|nr:hypothetical protein [Thermoproteota archaeon]